MYTKIEKQLKRFCLKKNTHGHECMRHVHHTDNIVWASDANIVAWTEVDEKAPSCEAQKLPDVQRVIDENKASTLTKFSRRDADHFRRATKQVRALDPNGIVIAAAESWNITGESKEVNEEDRSTAEVRLRIKNNGQKAMTKIASDYLKRTFTLFKKSSFSAAVVGGEYSQRIVFRSGKWNVIITGIRF